MNDRELLEAAAKAAEYSVRWAEVFPPSGSFMLDMGPQRDPLISQWLPWNPLADDGDALRLAVKLKFWLRYRDDASVNICWYDEAGVFAGNVTEEWGSLRNGDEPNAHVRRAIVRAAAETSRAKGGSE